MGPHIRLKDFALGSAVYSPPVHSHLFLGWVSLPCEYNWQSLILYLWPKIWTQFDKGQLVKANLIALQHFYLFFFFFKSHQQFLPYLSVKCFFHVDKNVQNKAKNAPCQHAIKNKAYVVLTYCPLFFDTENSFFCTILCF